MSKQTSTTERIIAVAAGRNEADLVLKNANVINVFTQEIICADVAIAGDRIAGVGKYTASNQKDCTGLYLCPGLIDAHCHIESSMAAPTEFSRAVLPSGTTTLITDPHEIVNVCGLQGLQWMLQAAEEAVCDIFTMLPSCVPATPFETSGAAIFAEDMRPFASHPKVLGLAEMMNFPGVISGDSAVLDKIDLFQNRLIDGHAPGANGNDLQAYTAAGISTDHEATGYEEAIEKLRAGLAILIREGSAAQNLKDILKGFVNKDIDTSRLLFCTDDKHLDDIRQEGHIIHNIRLAIQLGISPITAISMATYNTANHYGLHDRGAVAAGRKADLLLLSDLKSLQIVDVLKDGKASSDLLSSSSLIADVPDAILHSVYLQTITPEHLQLSVEGNADVIEMIPGQILTNHLKEKVQTIDGYFVPSKTHAKLCVLERHGKNGNIAVAPLKGYGITGGAVATSVAHDSHNIIAAGDNDADIALAINHIRQINGGYAVVQNGIVTGSLPLQIAGLMSTEPFDKLETHIGSILAKAALLGITDGIEPFISLSFLALPVIPTLRLTDTGLIDLFQS